MPKPHEARYEIQFTPIHHIDTRPVECDTENECKDEIFGLKSVKIEEEHFENENSKFEENGNHEIEQHRILTNKSNSTDCNINDVRKEILKKDIQTVFKKGNRPAKIMKKNLKQSIKMWLRKNCHGHQQKTFSPNTFHTFIRRKRTQISLQFRHKWNKLQSYN